MVKKRNQGVKGGEALSTATAGNSELTAEESGGIASGKIVKTNAVANTLALSRNKSGRFWKEPKTRASSIKKHKRDSLTKKLKDRQDRKRSKELTQCIKDAVAEEARLKRQRQADAKKRKEENARKSEVVQKIKNTSKIKKMKKKQLRLIQKRDTTDM